MLTGIALQFTFLNWGKDYNETLVRYLTVAEKATEQRTVDNSEEVAVTNTTQRSR